MLLDHVFEQAICLTWVTHVDRISVHYSDETGFDFIEKYLIAYQFRWNTGLLSSLVDMCYI